MDKVVINRQTRYIPKTKSVQITIKIGYTGKTSNELPRTN